MTCGRMLQRPRAAALSVLVVLLTGCWKQEDVITIDIDGTTSFKTSVVIEDRAREFAVSDVDDCTDLFIEELIDAGWKVERSWVSRERPYKLTFSGSGNLKTAGNASDFYNLERLDEANVKISFVPAEREGMKSSRKIIFLRRLFSSDADVVDPDGNLVTEIENVNEGIVYTIKFE